MGTYQMTAEQAVQAVSNGIENTFKHIISIELEKQAKPIIEAAAAQLARGLMIKISSLVQQGPFEKSTIILRIDGVDKAVSSQVDGNGLL